ncbi:trypsin-like serine peptidase [Actinoplanes sp. NPDC049265]|uniref:trypsin-like serine peptidase n=1 Tax=Actinoplanes sp. NPDC049265 TaxID=3363902 RepID=UPI00371DE5FE
MRRKAGIVVGACAALVLAGSAGAVVWKQQSNDERRPVGGWREAPAEARTPVAVLSNQRPTTAATQAATETPTAAATSTKPVSEDPRTHAEPVKHKRAIVEESAAAAAAKGRQKVGRLLRVDKLLGYARTPATETFRYPGASYVKLHFDRMVMAPGDYLTVSDAKGQESYRYDAPALVEGASVDKWAMSVTGDTAVVKVHRAVDPLGARSLAGEPGVRVDRVARGFTRTEQGGAPEETLTAPGHTGREESVCGSDESKDAVCYKAKDPVAYTRSKAVARLLIDGTELCTGWRVGTRNRMLTNNHCFDNSDSAYDTEVWFNYQCATCGGYDTFKPTKVWGDKVLATNHTLDYTLFTVENFGAIQKYGYLQLDNVRPAKGQPLYVPQHPAGDPTRIAGSLGEKAGNCAVADNAYTGYQTASDVSYYCDTEGGSSGSPVISRRTNRVVALHHFGGCPNSGVRSDLLLSQLSGKL